MALPARTDDTRGPSGRQSPRGDSADATRSITVDQYFAVLRQCIADCGWTLDALSVEMQIDKGYLWKLLHNEKPGWHPKHEIALPNDVEALFASRRAEQFGRIVVAPAVDEMDAARQFIAGLFGLIAPKRMAKATLEGDSR